VKFPGSIVRPVEKKNAAGAGGFFRGVGNDGKEQENEQRKAHKAGNGDFEISDQEFGFSDFQIS
jgi:hypothetical protein